MGNEPFVSGKQKLILFGIILRFGSFCVGSLWKDHCCTEFLSVYVAWSIVKRSRIYLDHCACRNQKCFHLSGIICTVFFNVLFLSQDQDRSEEHTSELQSRFDLVCRL